VSPRRPEGWLEHNQRYLTAALAVLSERLRRLAAQEAEGGSIEALECAASDAAAALPAPSALEQVSAAFGLSSFERDLLLLSAGVELDTRIATLCAAANKNPRGVHPTFSLALSLLPHAHWSALSPGAPLRRYCLVEIEPGDTLTSSPLRISERVLHHLVGIDLVDEQLAGLVDLVASPERLAPSQGTSAARLADVLSRARASSVHPAVHLAGEDSAGKRAVAAAACASLGIALRALRGVDVPADAALREALLHRWDREALLREAALLVDCDEIDGADLARAASFADRAVGTVLLASRSPVHLARTTVRVEVPRPSVREQRAIWIDALGPVAGRIDGRLDDVVSNFNLGTEAIERAAQEALALAGIADEEALGRELWTICRAGVRPRLDDLATRVRPRAGWEDLVLSEEQRASLRDIAAQVRQRYRVYEAWGFGEKSARGLGVSALFEGPSGTGKTMAAEVLAGELGLDLYAIDLSQLISKYIGETEKNLKRVFDAADEGGAILLFDEADAIFGKRSEVTDSHDRYANIEVSYLLQRMEAHRGLAILTTNMKGALDAAFLRRLKYVISFPFPDTARRAEIWGRVFPRGVPTEGIDVHKLARLALAGGNIRNIALNAAFLAADAGEPVRMRHLLRAARAECQKLERPETDDELGAWV
jgi:hypothetical protein